MLIKGTEHCVHNNDLLLRGYITATLVPFLPVMKMLVSFGLEKVPCKNRFLFSHFG